MKLFTFIVLAVMLVATTALAAEVPTSQGDKAMVFMFNGLDDLSVDGYASYGIGMRYYIANGTALRVGLQFGKLSHTDVDIDWEDDYNTYGVSAIYEKHMAGPCSSVSPFWGVGAGYSAFSDKDTDDAGDTLEYMGSGYTAFGVLGFEWAFTNCMTLGGEYSLGFASSSEEMDLVVGGVSNTFNEHEYSGMGFATASVYLSVYW